MEKDFCLGMLVGVLGGAIAAANSFKVRKTVKDGQEQIISAISKMSKTSCKSCDCSNNQSSNENDRIENNADDDYNNGNGKNDDYGERKTTD